MISRRHFIGILSSVMPLSFFSTKALAKGTAKEPASVHLGGVFYYKKHKVQIFENKRRGYGSVYKAGTTELLSPVCNEKNKHTTALNVVRRLYVRSFLFTGKNRQNDDLENFYVYIDTYDNGAFSVIGAEMELEYQGVIAHDVKSK